MISVILVTPSAGAEEEKFVTSSMLLEVLATQDIDKIRSTLGSVRTMRYQGEVLPILHDVWKANKVKYRNLEWSTLQKPIVKAELADILSQAWRNGKIKLDAAEFHASAVRMIESDDVEVVLIALQTLEVFDREDDVTKIANIARKGEIGTFQMAISTLTLMCNPSADKAVLMLSAETKNIEHRRFINDTKIKTDSFKRKTSICSSKKKWPSANAD